MFRIGGLLVALALAAPLQAQPPNSTSFWIEYPEPVTLVDAGLFSMQGLAPNPVNGRLLPVEIPLTSISVNAGDPRRLDIVTGLLVPEGATLSIAAGAVANQSTGQPRTAESLTTTFGVTPKEFTFAYRGGNGFRATNLRLFGADPNHPPAVLDQPIPEPTVRADFTAFMDIKLVQGIITQAERDNALALYDAPATIAKVPDANLRAALLSLRGTFAEATIATVLSGQHPNGDPIFREIGLDASLASGTTAVSRDNGDGSRSIFFNTNVQGESIHALAATMAHEALHQDTANGRNEEVIADTIATLAYIQQVAVDPSSATTGGRLVAGYNTNLIGILNSGANRFTNPGILVTPLPHTPNIFNGLPEYFPFVSFETYIRFLNLNEPNVDTPGHELIDLLLSNLTNQPVTGVNFNSASIGLVDGQTFFDAEASYYLAELLQLSIAPPLTGDYNHDGVVDAADYVVWRKGDAVAATPQAYDDWRANFAATDGSLPPEAAGSGALAGTLLRAGLYGTGLTATVPEPGGAMLALVAILAAIVGPVCRTGPRRWRNQFPCQVPLGKRDLPFTTP